MLKKVNVLMATYNGEKYIKEQLDSLINQTYKNIDVFIRDDGSTDNTVEIINEYCKKSNDFIRFHFVNTEAKNLGYPDCFWELLRVVPKADYYAFCDQDDWWYPEKIKNTVDALESVDSNVPAMAFCQFDYHNQQMEYIRKGDVYEGDLNFIEGMYYTFAPGFTQIINDALVQKLDISYIMGKNLAHDIWCQWISTSLGKTIQVNQVLAKYRRHEKAVTSSNQGKLSSIKYWWNEEIKGEKMKQWKQSLQYFYKAYENEFPDEMRKEILLFVEDKPSFVKKMKKVMYSKKLRPTKGGELALKILFMLGIC